MKFHCGKAVERLWISCGKLLNAQFGLDLLHCRFEQRILFDHLSLPSHMMT